MEHPQNFWSVQSTVVLVFGMLLQILMGGKSGFRLVTTVVIATLFVGWYITPALIELSNINPDSKTASAIMAMSALISVEIIAVLLAVLPTAVAKKAKSFLGVQDANA